MRISRTENDEFSSERKININSKEKKYIIYQSERVNKKNKIFQKKISAITLTFILISIAFIPSINSQFATTINPIFQKNKLIEHSVVGEKHINNNESE